MDTSLMVFIILTIVFISLSLTNKGESKSQIRFKSFFVARQIWYKQFRTAWIFFLLLRHLAVMMGVFFNKTYFNLTLCKSLMAYDIMLDVKSCYDAISILLLCQAWQPHCSVILHSILTSLPI